MNPETLIPGQHTGFLPADPILTDWQSGGETGIQTSPINASADWSEYQSPGKWQRDMRTLFETDACVSFSALDDLQTWGNFHLRNSLWDATHMAWLAEKGYLDETGHLSFSPRFVAKVSATTMVTGNTLPNVWNAIRKYGLVPESAWPSNFEALVPAPEVSGQTQQNWDIYYADIPADILAIGKEFLQHFQVNWEWVAYPGAALTPEGIASQLKFSPLQIATAVCMPWNTSQVINGCGAGAAHATMMAAEDTTYHILDHYEPFEKELALDYVITYATRGILVPVSVSPTPTPFHHIFNTNLFFGETASPEVSCLQTALQTLKDRDGVPYMKAGIFGPFGHQTRVALAAFQQDHNIADDGTHFGPQTRAVMNAALNS